MSSDVIHGFSVFALLAFFAVNLVCLLVSIGHDSKTPFYLTAKNAEIAENKAVCGVMSSDAIHEFSVFALLAFFAVNLVCLLVSIGHDSKTPFYLTARNTKNAKIKAMRPLPRCVASDRANLRIWNL
jgi:hypothetical protein